MFNPNPSNGGVFHTGILVGNKKGRTTDTHNLGGLRSDPVEWEKPGWNRLGLLSDSDEQTQTSARGQRTRPRLFGDARAGRGHERA